MLQCFSYLSITMNPLKDESELSANSMLTQGFNPNRHCVKPWETNQNRENVKTKIKKNALAYWCSCI